jgi:hypothetical protein
VSRAVDTVVEVVQGALSGAAVGAAAGALHGAVSTVNEQIAPGSSEAASDDNRETGTNAVSEPTTSSDQGTSTESGSEAEHA